MGKFEVTTHELKLPKSGVVLVMKDWITGYDNEAVQAIYYDGEKKTDGTFKKETTLTMQRLRPSWSAASMVSF